MKEFNNKAKLHKRVLTDMKRPDPLVQVIERKRTRDVYSNVESPLHLPSIKNSEARSRSVLVDPYQNYDKGSNYRSPYFNHENSSTVDEITPLS